MGHREDNPAAEARLLCWDVRIAPYVGTSEPDTLVLSSCLLSRLFHFKRYGSPCPDLFRDKLQIFYAAKYSETKSLSLPVPFAL